MDRRKFVTLAGIGGVVGAFSTQLLVKLPLIGVQPVQASAAQADTIKNLQAAYNGETNAHVRFLAFAKQQIKKGINKLPFCSKPPLPQKPFMPPIMERCFGKWAQLQWQK